MKDEKTDYYRNMYFALKKTFGEVTPKLKHFMTEDTYQELIKIKKEVDG